MGVPYFYSNHISTVHGLLCHILENSCDMTLTNLRHLFVKLCLQMINWVKRILTYFWAIFSYAYYTYFNVRNKIRIIRTVALCQQTHTANRPHSAADKAVGKNISYFLRFVLVCTTKASAKNKLNSEKTNVILICLVNSMANSLY